MVKCIYSTEVHVNDPKNKTLAIVLYATIQVNGTIVCKTPLAFDIFLDSGYDVTKEYITFIRKWEDKNIQEAQDLLNVMMRFYLNIEDYLSQIKKI